MYLEGKGEQDSSILGKFSLYLGDSLTGDFFYFGGSFMGNF
jgi:hypothetical protein